MSLFSIKITPIFTLHLFCMAVMVFLGFIILLKNRKKVSNQLFFGIVISLAFWIVTSGLCDVFESVEHPLFFLKTVVIGPFIASTFFLFFTYHFPLENKVPRKVFYSSVFFLIIALVFVPTNLYVKGVEIKSWGADFIPGVLYYFLLFFVLSHAIGGVVRILKIRQKLSGIKRKQVNSIISSVVLLVFIGIITNLILPLFGYNKASVYGAISTLLFVFVIAFAIQRHNLFNLKIIIVHLFTFTVSAILFLEVFKSNSIEEVILKICLIFIIIGFSIILTRSMNSEIKRKMEVEHLNIQLENLLKSKDVFLGIVNHQLRSPLATLKNYLYSWQRKDNDKKQKIISEQKIINSVYQLDNVTHELLTLLSLDKKTNPLKYKSINLKELISRLALEYQKKYQTKNIDFIFILPKKEIYVLGHHILLREAFKNLFDNALKYTQNQGIIRASLEKKNEQSVFELKNTCSKQKENQNQDFFHEFKRGNYAQEVNPEGSGLGLYLVKKIIEKHKGKVEGRQEGGCFVVRVFFG